jgi:hypothetical protein
VPATPSTDVKYPPHAKLRGSQTATHDFALLILKVRAGRNIKIVQGLTSSDTGKILRNGSSNMHPTAGKRSMPSLPPPSAQGAEHYGLSSVAAGWGRYTTPDVSNSQALKLKQVTLTVSRKRYQHRAMFGTVLRKKQGTYQDPCSGDSGGPLMYRESYGYSDLLPGSPDGYRWVEGIRWVIIGTLFGGGFDCRTGRTSTFEGSNNGLWNKVGIIEIAVTCYLSQVSSHSNWIKKVTRSARSRGQ